MHALNVKALNIQCLYFRSNSNDLETPNEGMTLTEYTNSGGKAVIRWSDSYSVKTIYIDGDDSGVSCPDGGSVTIQKS